MSVPKNMPDVPLIRPKKAHQGRNRVAQVRALLTESDEALNAVARALRTFSEKDQEDKQYDIHTANLASLGAPLFIVRKGLEGVFEMLGAVEGQMPLADEAVKVPEKALA